MAKKYLKTIRKWAKLRHPDPKFADAAINLYNNLDKVDKAKMLAEFQDYISGVESGRIIPSTPKIPIRVFKK